MELQLLLAQIKLLLRNDSGQDLVEYAMLICLVAIAAIAGVNQVASAVTTVFSNISASLA
jgi:Flp pilus assembly pilin Flp